MARKILLADDSVTAQNMGRKILADAGYEVITVNNGSAALKKIAELKPDLIVLDVYMPGYSGLEVCQRLKEAQETARVPVLLTVGKLEPFKPEEAKRARADGFIVKPFEASELLSALSKLEDKIVPRAEPSKPGRFARATAALDEARYDKSVAIDEDSGWKNRINFPTKKKEKVGEEDGDDGAIYNAMNKDLRTVVDQTPADQARSARQEAKAEEARVDLGALAAEGLPKDVTPEEIAALAAAAAQVKGKIADAGPIEPYSLEHKTEKKFEAEPEVRSEAKAEVKIEASPEVKAEPAALAADTAQPPAATFAERKPEEKISEENIKAEASKEAASISALSVPAPSPADVIAAIAGLEVDAVSSPLTATVFEPMSGNGSWSHGKADPGADEPVTMAVAAGLESGAAGSRWTAVAVALAPEEAAISLEQEMQKAYAAFAAAETGHSTVVAPPQTQPVEAEPAPAAVASIAVEAAPVESKLVESKFVEAKPVESSPVGSARFEAKPFQSVAAPAASVPSMEVPATPAPEAVQGLSAMAHAATDAITAAVQELEAVAASYLEHKKADPQPELAPVQKSDAHTPAVSEASLKIEDSIEDSPNAAIAEPAPAEPASEVSQLETKLEAAKPEQALTKEELKSEPVAPVAASEEPKVIESAPAAVSVDAVSAEEGSAPRSGGAGEPVAPPARDAASKESEISANTAAAWASWRRIRESAASGTQPAAVAKEVEENAYTPQDAAAMAVAAGAEKAPEEASGVSDSASESEPDGIANIVDSVLAEMRPKIYEEISRKMKKK